MLMVNTNYYAEAGYGLSDCSEQPYWQASIDSFSTYRFEMFHAVVPVALSNVCQLFSPELVTWYDAPTAGNLLFTGDRK